jgi:hypothetical protein
VCERSWLAVVVWCIMRFVFSAIYLPYSFHVILCHSSFCFQEMCSLTYRSN